MVDLLSRTQRSMTRPSSLSRPNLLIKLVSELCDQRNASMTTMSSFSWETAVTELFKLITADSPGVTGFDDDFADVVITPSYLRRVLAPQTCAISKQELVHLVKSDHIQGDNEVDFVERKFLPFPESNQILIIRKHSLPSNEFTAELSAPIFTCLINAYGRLHFVEENKVVCLPKLLSEMLLKPGHSIELSCADVCLPDSDGCLAMLATCWVELNEHFCPCRFFGAMFKISPTLHIELTHEIKASAPIAHCSLITKVINGTEHKYWINYESAKRLSVYELKQDSDKTGRAAFEIPLTNSSGVLLASTQAAKQIKFSGPISVLEFVPYLPVRTPRVSDGEGPDPAPYIEERFLVVSSTLGPVAIWRCLFEDDELSWNNEFVLSQSEQFDTITSACIISGNIAVGTYCGKILFYTSPYDLLCHEIASMTQVHAPIVNMKVLDHKTLCVLSTAGLHTVTRSDI
ncbi:hypothetical protein COOONC_04685 [Cooperia oncophora]